MKKQSIFRTSDKKGAKGYTPITNNILQSKEMTLDEVGLLVYLLSLPKNFKVLKVSIRSMVSNRISKGRFKLAWDSLKEKGHLIMNTGKEKNLNRTSWSVYETPEIRDTSNQDSQIQDTQNQDTRKTPTIESTHVESTQVESKNLDITDLESNNLESTNIIINTGAHILDENSYKAKKRKGEPDFFLNEAKNEAAKALTGATFLGHEILNYCSPDKHHELLERVGNIKYDLLAANIEKYEFAIRELNKIKSSSTEGLATQQPT